jgi:hypothetical protein
MVGIAVLLLAAANLFGVGLWDGYRTLLNGTAVVGQQESLVFVADVVAMGVGASVAWFV